MRRTLLLCFVVTLLAAASSSAQTVVVMRDGSRLEVESYEVQASLVVITTLDGSLQSLPLQLVDLDATESAAAETVALRFGWTPGMTARVEVEAARTRSSAELSAPQQTTSRISHRLSVHDDAEGLLVALDDFEFPQLEGPAGAEEMGIANAQLERIAAMTPSYVVDSEGVFVKVVGIEELVAEVHALLDPAREAIEGAGDKAKALVDRVLSEEHLTALMAEQWNLMVGFWLEGDLELGARYELETTAPLPLLPGLELPMRLEFGATDWVTCESGATDWSCVELELHSYPDPEKVQEMMVSILQRFGGPSEAPQFEELHVENRVTLVAVPGTLLPHFLETVKTVRISGTTGGNPIRASQMDRRTTRIRWEP